MDTKKLAKKFKLPPLRAFKNKYRLPTNCLPCTSASKIYPYVLHRFRSILEHQPEQERLRKRPARPIIFHFTT